MQDILGQKADLEEFLAQMRQHEADLEAGLQAARSRQASAEEEALQATSAASQLRGSAGSRGACVPKQPQEHAAGVHGAMGECCSLATLGAPVSLGPRACGTSSMLLFSLKRRRHCPVLCVRPVGTLVSLEARGPS
eukprot:scaffold28785_cov21-Tisochrysis_lutea.AAC.1